MFEKFLLNYFFCFSFYTRLHELIFIFTLFFSFFKVKCFITAFESDYSET